VVLGRNLPTTNARWPSKCS